jgi:hypothetical protein
LALVALRSANSIIEGKGGGGGRGASGAIVARWRSHLRRVSGLFA